MPDVNSNHWHCQYGCEKALGQVIRESDHPDGELIICANCGGPWVPCTPEICDV